MFYNDDDWAYLPVKVIEGRQAHWVAYNGPDLPQLSEKFYQNQEKHLALRDTVLAKESL